MTKIQPSLSIQLLKMILLFPVCLLILVWGAVSVLSACRAKEGSPVSGYIKSDKGGVIYRDAFLGFLSLKDHVIAEADDATFEILNKHYAKDRQHAYYHQYPLDADPVTFEAIDDHFAKDKDRVYFEHRTIPEADPATVALLPREGFLIRDKARVYYQNDLISRDAGHFVKLGDLHGTYKSTDVVIVTYNVIPEADPATFTLTDSSKSNTYFKDKRHVYFNGIVIKGADADSFVAMNGNFAKDKNRAYCCDRPLSGADCSSFEVVDETRAKDKFRQYSTEDMHQ